MDLYVDYCLKHQVCKVHHQTLEVNKASGLQSRPSPLKVLLDITMCQVQKISTAEEKIFFHNISPPEVGRKLLQYIGNIL
jgi:hypothetical protein